VCLFIQLKPDIETAVGANFPVYSPLSFRLQIVAGINYLVKVKVFCFSWIDISA